MHRSARIFLLVISLLAGIAFGDAACAHPAMSSPAAAAFGSKQTLHVGQSIAFPDGLIIDLYKINDSRCPAGVQCIWAGELAAELMLHGGSLGSGTQTVLLGTERATQRTLAGYSLALADATPDSATVVVTAAVDTVPGGGPPRRNMLRLRTPHPNQLVGSPLTVRGWARGGWFSEGSFPISLVNAHGAVLGRAQGRANGNWMTSRWVPFSARIAFSAPMTPTGMLLLENDNPSGEPRNARTLRLPVRFAPIPVDGGQSWVHGRVTSGPTCPVERVPPDPACADRPQVATFSIDTPAGAHVATVTSTPDGSLAVRLSPGTYVISLVAHGPMPSMASQTFTVRPYDHTVLQLRLDSGIR